MNREITPSDFGDMPEKAAEMTPFQRERSTQRKLLCDWRRIYRKIETQCLIKHPDVKFNSLSPSRAKELFDESAYVIPRPEFAVTAATTDNAGAAGARRRKRRIEEAKVSTVIKYLRQSERAERQRTTPTHADDEPGAAPARLPPTTTPGSRRKTTKSIAGR